MDVQTVEDYKLTAGEVARMLKISERTLHNWRAKKSGPPFIKLGAVYRYSKRSLEDWMISKVER